MHSVGAGVSEIAFLTFALLIVSGQARADKPRDDSTCTSAHENANALERAGKLRKAKEALLECVKPACDSFTRQECTSRYLRLDAEIPSVIPVATDDRDDPLVQVDVQMDGRRLVSRIDGHAVEVDPGLHVFSFIAEGKAQVKQRVMVVQGQRNRPIAVSLRAPSPSQDPIASDPRSIATTDPGPPPEPIVAQTQKTLAVRPEASDVPLATYVLAGAGVAAFGTGALFTYWGRKDNRALGNCTPFCPPESVDHVKKMYLASDVAFGAGIAAIAASCSVLVASRYTVDVQPTRSGAVASLVGRF